MFIRTKTTPNSPRKSVQIVENTRDKFGKVKQKIIRYVGIAMNDAEEAKLKQLAEEIIQKIIIDNYRNSFQLSLFDEPTEEEISKNIKKKFGRKPKKKLEDIMPTNQLTFDMVKEEARIIDGVHEVVGHLYNELNFYNVLQTDKYRKILKDLVLCRISNPKSKLATTKILKRYYMQEHDINAAYRTMDKVFDNLEKIKTRVFESTYSLIPGGIEIMLFDVTTLHFESIDVDELRKFGWSKNAKFNNTQVVLALATTEDGLPIGYELFEGNKAEVKTLVASIDKWKTLFQINDVTFIGDRAMFSAENLAELDKRNYKYIVAAKLRGLPEIMQDKIMDANNYSVTLVGKDLAWISELKYDNNDIAMIQTNMQANGEKTGKIKNYIKKYQELILQNKDRRIVVSYNSKRAGHDSKKRDQILEKIEKQLSKTTDSVKLVSNSGLKKYTSTIGKSKAYIDKFKIDNDVKWDGIHGVITNIPQENGTTLSYILDKYKRLVKIEDCFRVNKSTLKMRPIYHWKSTRIQAHIAICYMAFAVLRQLEYRTKLLKKLSIDNIIEELNSVQSSIYVHKITKDRYRMPGNFSNEARKIYNSINLTRSLDAHPII